MQQICKYTRVVLVFFKTDHTKLQKMAVFFGIAMVINAVSGFVDHT